MLPILNNSTVFWELGGKYPREFTSYPPEEYLEQTRGGIYFVVNQLGDKYNEKKHLRHGANVTYLLSFFTDFDIGTKESQLATIHGFLKPSAIVESGRGYHAYWELREPVSATQENVQTWSHIQTCLATQLNGDKACSDPARLMRLPRSWHRGQNMLVTIVERSPVRYTFADFLKRVSVPKRVTYTSSKRYKPLAQQPQTAQLKEGERHNALLKMAGQVFHNAAPRDTEYRTRVLEAWYIDSCDPLDPSWEDEVRKAVEWVTKKEFHG